MVWNSSLWEQFKTNYGYSLTKYVKNHEFNKLTLEVKYDVLHFLSRRLIHSYYGTFFDVCRIKKLLCVNSCLSFLTNAMDIYSKSHFYHNRVGCQDSERMESLRLAASASMMNPSLQVIAEIYLPKVTKKHISGNNEVRHYNDFDSNTGLMEKMVKIKRAVDECICNGASIVSLDHAVHEHMINGPKNICSPQNSRMVEKREAISSLNTYITTICRAMYKRRPYQGSIAILCRHSDLLMNEVSAKNDAANHKIFKIPQVAEGYHPLWISEESLKLCSAISRTNNGNSSCSLLRLQNEHTFIDFCGIIVDCEWLSLSTVEKLLVIVQQKVPIILLRSPKEPGTVPPMRLANYNRKVVELQNLSFADIQVVEKKLNWCPLIRLSKKSKYNMLPFKYWVNEIRSSLYIFVAEIKSTHFDASIRKSSNDFAQRNSMDRLKVPIEIFWKNQQTNYTINLEYSGSLILVVSHRDEKLKCKVIRFDNFIRRNGDIDGTKKYQTL